MNDNDQTKPTAAVALYYDGENAPILTAKGRQDLAEQIIATAEAHDVPLHQDADLTQFLSSLDLGEAIPKNLYIAIAKVIAFAYMLNDKVPKFHEP